MDNRQLGFYSNLAKKLVQLVQNMEEGSADLLFNPMRVNLTASELEKFKKIPNVDPASVRKEVFPLPANPQEFSNSVNRVFPHDTTYFKWSIDNFGGEGLIVPKKGWTIQLTRPNVSTYRRCISIYENNQFEERNGKYYINGNEAASYTFKMDYFWMMGDNRHKSQDSRYWGFVPEDRVAGKAWMIWFSWDGGPRWSRFFKMIK